MSQKEPILLWDLPTRIFHWSLVIAIPLAWWSAENEKYELHEWLGYTLIVLVVSRILWGFIGSAHSRFSDFLVGPRRVVAYMRKGEAASVGHNPLGGWSVLALLALILLQAVSGLFNSDDVLFSGPLYYWASGDFRDAMGTLHDLAFNALMVLVALHVLAVLFHQLVRREKLLQAMLKGWADGREGRAGPVPVWRVLLILGAVALLLWWGLGQAPQPQPFW